MAFFYVDAATGTDSLSNGGSWATACASLFYLLNTATANPAAGDTVFMRANSSETTKDTTAASLTIATPGTVAAPLKIIGVVAGTTNEGTSVVAADLAVKSGDQPVLEVTGAGNDLTITGAVNWSYCRIDVNDRLILTDAGNTDHSFEECDIDADELYATSTAGGTNYFINCEINLVLGLTWVAMADMVFLGGTFTSVGTASNMYHYVEYRWNITFIGVDLSASTFTTIYKTSDNPYARATFMNCKMPASYAYITSGGWTDGGHGFLLLTGCHSTTTLAAGSSYQEYYYADQYGIVEAESTIVRTGGADDGATGGFSYKVTPHASRTAAGSMTSNIKTPWMRVWVAGGSAITATAYIVHDNTAGDNRDFYQDEAWLEIFTPDAADTAVHDFNIDHATGHMLENTTAITDDASSTWATVNTYKQKLSATVTPGYTGFVYGRVVVAKGGATPDVVYVDGMLEIS